MNGSDFTEATRLLGELIDTKIKLNNLNAQIVAQHGEEAKKRVREEFLRKHYAIKETPTNG